MNPVLVIFALLVGVVAAKDDTVEVKFANNGSATSIWIAFEAYTERGLRLLVSKVEEIDLVYFSGNINAVIRKKQNGQLTWEMNNPRDISSRVHNFTDVQLLSGDVINFWVRIEKDKRILINGPLHHIINGLTPGKISKESRQDSTQSHTESHNTSPTSTLRPNVDCNESALQSERTKLNMYIQNITKLEQQIRDLEFQKPVQKENIDELMTILEDLLKESNLGTTLLLTGDLPARTNPVEDVRHLLIEQLDLRPLSNNILQATYVDEGISFEMATALDKLKILRSSREKLSETKFKIIDPNREPSSTYGENLIGPRMSFN